MKVIVQCRDCKEEINIRTFHDSRFGLKKEFGDKMHLKCKKCSYEGSYKINEVKAKQGYAHLISFILLAVCIGLLVYYLWDYNCYFISSVYLIPIGLVVLGLIYSTFLREENKKITNFNRS